MKCILIVLFLLLNINANNLKKDLILNKYISKNNVNFKKFNSKDFRKDKYKNVYIKLQLNKKILKNRTFYLKVTCDPEFVKYSNIKYKRNFEYIIFKLDKSSPKELLLNIKYKKEQLLKLALTRFSNFEYKYILKKEYLLYGIAYGIIFCAFLYNFVIFLYVREKSFLYYSLMQFCLMITLYYAVLLDNQTFITVAQQILTDFFETMCVLFMILFSKEILNMKKNLKFLNKILNFMIYLSVVDLISIVIFNHSLLYSFVPRSLVVSTLVLSGFIAMLKGQKIAIYYFVAWFVVFFCLISIEHNFFNLNELYIIHIGLPLESIILSFALGYMLKTSIEEKKEKEKILIQQSKLASMGEMLNNIAHQWRQPLANLSFINIDLKMAVENNDVSNKYLYEVANDSSKQINFMSETLESFKGFYLPNKRKDSFKISQAIEKIVDMINPVFKEAGITIQFIIKKDKKILSYENEYSQAILNLLTNAKDALIEKNINNPHIKIVLDLDSNKKSLLSVSDNAGGIPKEIIPKIFDPYFTTKNKSSGIGLYMTKIIVESQLKGEIEVLNTSFGACFKIKV